MSDEELDQLRRTLAAQGIGSETSVSETLDPEAARLRRLLASEVDLPPTFAGELDPDYQVTGQLGRGGMAVVWLAEQLALGREVAIKRALDASDVEARVLLLREAVITGQLEHPNIVPVHALIGGSQGPAVVMKRLSGDTWDELIQRGELTLERQLEIFGQVLNAVAFAHSRGVLHGDIKPSNVMIGDFGEVYLLDWGVARRVSDPPSEVIMGTPRYMAPELAEGAADERSDVFLLGATLHEVLTREPRHRGDSALEVLYNAMHVEPFAYPDGVPEELAEIANRACAREPGERFSSASALGEALATFREHRAANTLSEAADAQLRELCVRLGTHTHETSTDAAARAHNAEVQQLFLTTRLGFEAALRIWPQSPSASRGLAECLTTMVDYELARQRPEPARALLAALRTPDPARELRAEKLEAEQTRELDRVRTLQLDRDPRVGAPDRTRAYRAMAIASISLSSTLFIERLFYPRLGPSTLRLTWVGGFVLVVMVGIVWWWRRHGVWNFINRRIAEIAISTLAVSFTNRLSGCMLHTPGSQVLVSDAFILGLGGAVLSAYHRAGPWLALVSFSVAVLGSIWPAATDELFLALSVFLPLVFLLLRRVEPGDDGASIQ